METHTTQLHRPHRQRRLESQRSDHEPDQSNTQAQHQPPFRQMAVRLRLTTTEPRRDGQVDDTLAAAAKRHQVGDSFL